MTSASRFLWQRWLLLVLTLAVLALAIVGVQTLFLKHRYQSELRDNGSDIIAIARYRDSTVAAPERSAHHQQALRAFLTRPRPTPYRGTPEFLTALGSLTAADFLMQSRRQIAAIGAYQNRLLSTIEGLDTRQTLFFLAALLLSLALPGLLFLYWRDAQQRLRLLSQLQASEARYRDLTEHLPDLVQSVAADGRFVYVNRYWRQGMGYSDEELRQLRIWDILRPDQLPKCRLLFERAFQEGSLFNVETVFVTKHGEEIYVSGNVTVQPDPITGEPVTRALFRDVTLQHHHMQLLRYQEALSNTTVRIARQLFAETNPEARFAEYAAQLAEVLGTDALYLVALVESTPQLVGLWVREEQLRQAVESSFEPAQWKEAQELATRIAAVAIVEASQEEVPACYRNRGVASLLWVPLTRYGQLWGLIGVEDWKHSRAWTPAERTALEYFAGIFLAVLERVHAYRQLQRLAEDLLEAQNTLELHAEQLRAANEELRERNAEKDRIMSIISHDLRSPLSGIRGLAELLQGEDAENPELVREFAQLIMETTEQLLSLVNDLLEVARLESGRVRLQLAPTDLCELARNALRLLEKIARSKGLTLTLECPATPVQVPVDAPKITQVINNLLSNAIKFTPSGGRVTLPICSLPEAVEICVEDTGIGIPPEHLPHLFEKFGPHQRPGTAGEKGTGLGLPIVKHFVELHGGTVQVESTPGVGTRFTVRIPFVPRTPSEANAGEMAASGSSEASPREAHA